MHSQINRAISSAISNRVILERQNIMGSLSSEHRETDPGASGISQESGEEINGVKQNLQRKILGLH